MQKGKLASDVDHTLMSRKKKKFSLHECVTELAIPESGSVISATVYPC